MKIVMSEIDKLIYKIKLEKIFNLLGPNKWFRLRNNNWAIDQSSIMGRK